MDDTEPPAIRQMIMQAVEQCKDLDLLDLIYKLLATTSIT
jgi:hypothetical protein